MPIHPLNDTELQQARDVSWNPAVRRLLDWYTATLNAPQHADAAPGIAAAAPANPVAFAPGAPAAPPAPVLPLPLISLSELRKLAAYTLPQVAGLMRTAEARVQDIESLDIELLDVDQLTMYTAALNMALTISVDLMPGAPREIYSTRAKLPELQKILGSPGEKAPAPEAARGLGSDKPPAQPDQQVVDGVDRVSDTLPPGPGEVQQVDGRPG
jgi:hypothetical protein